eukprot:555697-Amphidinium_carterae.1
MGGLNTTLQIAIAAIRNLHMSGDVGGVVNETLWRLAPHQGEGEAVVALYPVPQSEGLIWPMPH